MTAPEAPNPPTVDTKSRGKLKTPSVTVKWAPPKQTYGSDVTGVSDEPSADDSLAHVCGNACVAQYVVEMSEGKDNPWVEVYRG